MATDFPQWAETTALAVGYLSLACGGLLPFLAAWQRRKSTQNRARQTSLAKRQTQSVEGIQ